MDSFYLNKIAGAVLASLLVLVGVNTAIELFYPKGKADLSKGRIVVAPEAAAPASETPAQAEPEAPPLESLLAKASVEAGQSAAKACAACHNFAKGAGAKIGPDLYGIVGHSMANQPGFSYSSALQSKGGKWTPQNLNEWLKDPKAFIPGNKMAFAGIKNPQERANIIAFLNKQSDTPAPLLNNTQ